MKKAKWFLTGTLLVVGIASAVALEIHKKANPDLLICNITTDLCETSDYSDISGIEIYATGPFYKGTAGDECGSPGCVKANPRHIYFNQ